MYFFSLDSSLFLVGKMLDSCGQCLSKADPQWDSCKNSPSPIVTPTNVVPFLYCWDGASSSIQGFSAKLPFIAFAL